MIRLISVIATFLSLIAGISLNTFAQPRLPESPIKTIYISPLSHYDFGFVEPPDQVRERAARHIDEVIRVAEENPDFRWTIESVWQVNEWLKRQKKPSSVLPKDKEKISRLMKLIKSGQIAISMAWGSMHTDFMGAEELNRLAYDFATLKRTYGISSELATMNDVPGHPSSIPSVLAGSGAKYLVTGANIFIGDATTMAPGKVPFYWQSPDGSRILTWVSQGRRGGYVEALTDFYLDPFSLDPYTDKTPFDMFNPELAGKKTPAEIQEIGVTELLNRYNKAGYKYDAVLALYGHDFVEPDHVLNLLKAIKLWNDRHTDVKLKIATSAEFLKYIETKYGSQIPTVSGEWSGLWSEAKTQSPKISALARYAHDHTPAAETLWSAVAMTRSIPFPVGNASSLYDLMLTYDEHSGAGNNGWIQLNSRKPLEDQNSQYVGFMKKAKAEADFLLDQGVKVLTGPSRYDAPFRQSSANSWNLIVYNGLSWARDDVVSIKPPKENTRITGVRDMTTGRSVPFDIDEAGNAVFVAKGVPAFGYTTFVIATAPGKSVSTLREIPKNALIAGKIFDIKMTADGDIQSIKDRKTGREIVNDKGELPFNRLLRVEGQFASALQYPLPPAISVKKGTQMTRVTVLRERSAFPLTTISIFDDLDHVELRNEIGEKLPFVGGDKNWHDSYYFAFPFAVSTNGLKVLRGGQKWFDRLPDDYLPGARRDAVTTQHLIGMTDGNATALVAHRQSFHWVYPGYVSTKIPAQNEQRGFPPMFMGKFPLPEATIYSRAVRRSNQADTHDLGVINMETVEPNLAGNYVFDYAIAADGKFDEVRAWRMGANFNVPLRATYADVPPAKPTVSFFSIDQSNVQIVTVKALSDTVVRGEVSATPLEPQLNKVFVIRLQEFAGKAATVRIGLPVAIKAASIVNLTEDVVLQSIAQISPLTVEIKPFETKTVKIEIQ